MMVTARVADSGVATRRSPFQRAAGGENFGYEAVASSTTVSERDDRHSEAFSMFNTKALDGNRRGGHLLSSIWAVGVSPAAGAAREGNEPLHARWG